MRILLVYPEMPDTFYALRHFIELAGKKAAFPPLGLLTVAALLPENWDKKLIDLNIENLTDNALKNTDYVFLSAMNVQEESVRNVIAKSKKAGVKVVAGGPLFTHEFERSPEVDHFILNEAEITLQQFIDDVNKQHPQKFYTSKQFADVSQSPIPLFHLADMKKYLYAIVQYSRGCPYLCDFCDVTALFGRKPRVKSPTQIIRELEALIHNKNVQLILFADDNLIGNKRVLKAELLPALIEWRRQKNPAFYFATQLTVNLADDAELMHLMAEAGFRHIFIGIETPDEESLKVSHKNQNLKRNLLNTIHQIHANGFIISGGFIVGFDTDTEKSFSQMHQFIQKSGIPLPIVNILKAPPGTELFDRMKKENRLVKDFAFEEGDTNISPTMGEEALLKGFLKVIDHIYPPQYSIKRIKTFLTQYQYPKVTVKVSAQWSMVQLPQLIKIFWKLSITDPNRKYFWNLMIWAAKRSHKLIDKAFFYGMMMYQMHQTYLHIKNQVENRLQTIKTEI
jgi:radical SAM superfamily enzyme YgiQ (UPF0313 family)